MRQPKVFSSQNIASREGTLKAPQHLHAAVRTVKAWVTTFEAFCTRWIVWTSIRTKDFAKNQTSCGPCVLPWASCKANVESKAKSAPLFKSFRESRRWPALAAVSAPSTTNSRKPWDARETSDSFVKRVKHRKPPLQTLASVDTLRAQGGARSQQQELTQRLDTALKTDVANLVSELLLAPEAAAICKGLWPCLGDGVLGFSVHCGQVVFRRLRRFGGHFGRYEVTDLMFSWSSPSRSPTCWSARATCHFHLLQAWQRRFCPIWYFAILPSLPLAVFQFQFNSLLWDTCLSKSFKTDDLLIVQVMEETPDKDPAMWT